MSQLTGHIEGFDWTPNKEQAAMLLAQGETQTETAKQVGVSMRSISRWVTNPLFIAEVDRLSHMVSVSNRAERLRLVMRVVKQKTKGENILTEKDLLDWLKFAQSETDGVKLDLMGTLESILSERDK